MPMLNDYIEGCRKPRGAPPTRYDNEGVFVELRLPDGARGTAMVTWDGEIDYATIGQGPERRTWFGDAPGMRRP